MSKKLLNLLLVIMMLVVLVPPTLAAPPAQEGQDYVVVADDRLSKLAGKYLGNPMAYPAIVEYTNQKYAEDDSYAEITNPDLIEAGWKIYIPSTEEAAAVVATVERAMKYISANSDPDQWDVRSVHRREIAVLEDYAEYVHLVNRETGGREKVLFLGKGDGLLTEPELQRMIMDAEDDQYGKLTPELHDELLRYSPTDVLLVKVWAQSVAPQIPKPTTFTDDTAVYEYLARHRAHMREIHADSVAQLRAAVGELGRVTNTLEHMPVVIAEVPAKDVPLLAEKPAVARVGFAATEDAPSEVYQAGYTHFFDADDAESAEIWSNTHHGRDVRVGVLENANYCGIWADHPGFVDWRGYEEMAPAGVGINGCTGLADGTQCPVLCSDGVGFCRGGRCFKEHATEVASKLGSTVDGEVRNASELRMFFANDGTDEERLDWFVDNGVTIFNHSATLAASARDEINYVVRDQWLTVTKAVGNSQAQPVDCYVNAICVGSYSIVNPGNVDHWKLDPENSSGAYAMSGSTAYLNDPLYPEAEKPDVVGNGEASLVSDMATPATEVWNNTHFGTSFAAPMVGGLVAVFQEFWPTAKVWPEAVRPMLMVSARVHNVVGAPLSRNDAGGDEWDGAGVPTASSLRAIISNNDYELLTLFPGTFDADEGYDAVDVMLEDGSTIRAVLGWTYCAESGRTFLATDLDLYLIDKASGQMADVSASSTNSLEMLEYTHTGSARQFTLRIEKYGQMLSCGGVQREHAGLAWAVEGNQVYLPIILRNSAP